MLQSEVTHLRAPAQEEGGQRQHRRDVAHADVRDMNASGAEEREREMHEGNRIRNFYSIHLERGIGPSRRPKATI